MGEILHRIEDFGRVAVEETAKMGDVVHRIEDFGKVAFEETVPVDWRFHRYHRERRSLPGENPTSSIMDIRTPKKYPPPPALVTLFLAFILAGKSLAAKEYISETYHRQSSPWAPFYYYMKNYGNFNRDITTTPPQIQAPPFQQHIINYQSHVRDKESNQPLTDYSLKNSDENLSVIHSGEESLQDLNYPNQLFTQDSLMHRDIDNEGVASDNLGVKIEVESERKKSSTDNILNLEDENLDVTRTNITDNGLKYSGGNLSINHSGEESSQNSNYPNQLFTEDSLVDHDIDNEGVASDNLDIKIEVEAERKNSSTENILNLENENLDITSTNIRTRRAISRPGLRRGIHRRPMNDYDYKNRFRNRLNRRTTTSVYDDLRKRKQPSKKRPNRRPIQREPEYYDSEYKDEDYYEDDYNNVFARQGTTESDTTEYSTITTTAGSTTETTQGTTQSTGTPNTPTASTTQTAAPQTPGYTYGPPVQGGYGPPHTGYGPSNGNEHISITYPPVSEPGRDGFGSAFENWYNHYGKGSLLKRLQEFIQSNNYYNSQYDLYDNV